MRYIIFAYGDYYPKGGWNDYLYSFDELDVEHILSVLESEWDYTWDDNIHIVDTKNQIHGQIDDINDWENKDNAIAELIKNIEEFILMTNNYH